MLTRFFDEEEVMQNKPIEKADGVVPKALAEEYEKTVEALKKQEEEQKRR